MSENIDEGIKIAIVVIIVVALISTVFSVVSILSKIATSESFTLQKEFSYINEAEYLQFDRKMVSGVDIEATIRMFQDRDVSIVVRNKANTGYDENAQLYGAYLDVPNKNVNTGGLVNGETVDIKCALDVNGDAKTDFVAGSSNLTKYGTDTWYTAVTYVDNKGHSKFNVNIKPMSALGTRAYVRETGKYLAELIKNPAGDKIGVVFTQRE